MRKPGLTKDYGDGTVLVKLRVHSIEGAFLVILTLAEVKLNDRVILPPFARDVNYEFHSSQRRTSRRVLAISQQEESVTIVPNATWR